MLNKLLPCFALAAALYAGAPALAQEQTRDATAACDELSALEGHGCVPVGGGHQNRDGSYTDSNGYTVDGAGRGRATKYYNPDVRPYVEFQTSDARFNAIMNRVGNHPGVNACVTPEEREYIWWYMNEHPGIADSVRDHDLTGTCPGGAYEAADLRPLGVR
jgi:hypothetical protein